MDIKKLSVSKRTTFGRKVKKLRNEGILPANIYGKKLKSLSIQLSDKEFEKTYSEAGHTGLIELMLEKDKYPVLIHNVSYHPISRKPIHVEFLKVDLKEKINANVPLVLIGEAIAVKENKGTLLTLLSDVEVQALPSDLPENLKVDISHLSEIDQVVKLSEIKIEDKIKILTDLNSEIVRIAPIKIVEEAPVVKPAEEGQVPQEGEAVPKEKTESEQPEKDASKKQE